MRAVLLGSDPQVGTVNEALEWEVSDAVDLGVYSSFAVETAL